MIAAARISEEIGCCDQSTYERIRRATLAWGALPSVTVQTGKALKLIHSDKKTENGVVHFVLPKQIGRVEIVNNVSEQAITVALAEIRRMSRG
jgi:3-dehydroquinate synthase